MASHPVGILRVHATGVDWIHRKPVSSGKPASFVATMPSRPSAPGRSSRKRSTLMTFARKVSRVEQRLEQQASELIDTKQRVDLPFEQVPP